MTCDELPRVFILSVGRHFGGAEKSLQALLPDLSRLAKVTLFACIERQVDEIRGMNLPNLEIIPMAIGNSPVAMLGNLWKLFRESRRRRPQAILANGHRGSLILFLYRLLPGRPPTRDAVYVRDFAYDTFRWTLRGMRDVLFLAPTAAIFEHPPYRACGLARLRHEVLPNAAKLPEGSTEAADGPRFIGCCARLVPWKGIEYLIEAFASIAARNPDTRVRIYGEPIDEAYSASLHRLAEKLGVADRVEFHPFAADMHAVYRQGLFFVIPSLSVLPGPESFSRIIIEAWAHARPVIAFSCGGPRLLIEDGRDGFLVEERDVAQLAARMEELVASPALTARLGQAGEGKARALYSPAGIARELLSRLLPATRDEAREPAPIPRTIQTAAHHE